jgi:hypothetical protein
MAYQGFSPKLKLAQAFSSAKSSRDPKQLDEAEKTRIKQLSKARQAARIAENMAQRALVELRRTQS